MSLRARSVVAATLLLGVAWLGANAASAGRSLRRDHSVRQRFDAALTAQARGDFALALQVYFEGWKSDPSNAGFLWELSPQIGVQLVGRELRDSVMRIAAETGDSSFRRCVAMTLSDAAPANALSSLIQAKSSRARRCARLMSLLQFGSDSLRLLLELLPRSAWAVHAVAFAEVQSDPARGVQLAERIAKSNQHPMLRFGGSVAMIDALHEVGAHREAESSERDAMRRARNLGPGAELKLYAMLMGHEVPMGPQELDDSRARHARDAQELAVRELIRLRDLVDAEGQAMIAFQLGMKYQASGRQPRALAEFRRLAALADSAGSPVASANAHARVGRTLVKLGRLEEAEAHLEKARRTGEAAGAIIALREVSHDLLHLQEARGAYGEAEAAGRSFIAYSNDAGTVPTRMMGHHDLGWLYRRRGMMHQAQREFALMIADIDLLQGHFFWAGEYFESMGQLERARDYYLRSLGYIPDRSRALAGLVRIDEMTGQLESALRHARLADRDTATWDPEYAPLLPGLLARNGRLAEARARLRESRHMTRRAGKTLAFAKTALESAEIELKTGDPKVAAALADSAVEFAALLGASELEVRAIAAMALALARGGDGNGAIRAMNAAVRRGDAMSLVQLSAYVHSLRAEVLRTLGRRSAAMIAYEAAADLVDSLALGIANDPLRALFRSLHDRVYRGAMDLAATEGATAGRLDAYGTWSARRKGGSLQTTLAAVVGALAPDEAIVDFFVGDSTVSALVVTRAGPALASLAMRPDSLRALVAAFNAPIAPRVGSAIDLSHIGFDTTAARRLYAALIEPLAGLLDNRTRLTIVPDGVLHLLSFDALLISDGPPRFMVDDYTIRYATSLEAQIQTRPRLTPGGVLAIGGVADDAPVGTAREIAALRDVLGDVLSPIGTSDESTLRQRASAAGVLHFATHAEANDASPDQARLALVASSEGTVTWLYAFEIREWQLRDALVVLSACDTGAGRVAGGQGTLSLSRAFLRAGASGTIATLWPVGEPTAEFMKVLYGELARGTATDVALRRARLAMRALHPEPYYWAPFVYLNR